MLSACDMDGASEPQRRLLLLFVQHTGITEVFKG